MTKIFCDRCEKECTGYTHKVELEITSHHSYDEKSNINSGKDFCKNCMIEIKEMFLGKVAKK